MGWDGSDVYVYYHVDGYYVCCFCNFAGEELTKDFGTAERMLIHLRRHVAAGDKVPWYAIDALKIETGELKSTNDLRWAIFCCDKKRPRI